MTTSGPSSNKKNWADLAYESESEQEDIESQPEITKRNTEELPREITPLKKTQSEYRPVDRESTHYNGKRQENRQRDSKLRGQGKPRREQGSDPHNDLRTRLQKAISAMPRATVKILIKDLPNESVNEQYFRNLFKDYQLDYLRVSNSVVTLECIKLEAQSILTNIGLTVDVYDKQCPLFYLTKDAEYVKKDRQQKNNDRNHDRNHDGDNRNTQDQRPQKPLPIIQRSNMVRSDEVMKREEPVEVNQQKSNRDSYKSWQNSRDYRNDDSTAGPRQSQKFRESQKKSLDGDYEVVKHQDRKPRKSEPIWQEKKPSTDTPYQEVHILHSSSQKREQPQPRYQPKQVVTEDIEPPEEQPVPEQNNIENFKLDTEEINSDNDEQETAQQDEVKDKKKKKKKSKKSQIQINVSKVAKSSNIYALLSPNAGYKK